jgi:hypothetical protein
MNKKDEFLMLLLEAVQEPIGILVATNDFERARQKFYAVRREAKIEALDQLQIRMSPFSGGELIIVNSKIKLEAPK